MNGKMKALLLLFLFMLFFLTASGCWNRQEPEDLALVNVMGLDRDEEGQFKIIVLIANPQAMGGNGENGGSGGDRQERPEWIASSSGRTIFEAFRNLDNKITRQLNLTHLSILLISEELAREGLLPMLDFFDRERQTRMQVSTLVVDGDMRRAMEARLPLEDNWFAGILIQKDNNFRLTGNINDEIFRTIVQRLAQPGWELKLPRLQVLETEEGLAEESSVLLSGTASFKGDRMVDWCNDQETRGFLWLTNEIERTFYVLDSPSPDGGQLSVEIFETNTQLEARVEGDQVFVTVEVTTDGRLQESTGTEDWLAQETELARNLDRRLGQAVRNDILAALNKGQKDLSTDVVGFGNLIYRTMPREWERLGDRWEEIFPEVEVEVLVDANVRRTGLVKDTVRIIEN